MCHARRSRTRERAAVPRHAVAELVPTEGRCACFERSRSGWAGGRRSLATLWGLPAAAMLVAVFLEPEVRAVTWTAMLLWMGGACLANAHRCSRTHCRFTGPFFSLMGAAVAAYASGLLPLGRHGWTVFGIIASIGAISLWWATNLGPIHLDHEPVPAVVMVLASRPARQTERSDQYGRCKAHNCCRSGRLRYKPWRGSQPDC